MSSTAPATDVTSTYRFSVDEEKSLRKQARRRASLCPGAGWALLGYPGRGKAVLLCVALWLLAMAWLVLTLSPASVLAAGVTLPVALAVWTAEVLDTRWCRVHPAVPSALVQRFGLSTLLVWAAGMILPLLIVRSFGSIEIDDERMMPGIESGERLIYHRHVTDGDLMSGQVILYRLPPHAKGGTPGEMVVARILAAPDDELTIRDGHYVVNGELSRNQPPGAIRKAPLSVPTYPKKLIVPQARYFIVQDSLNSGLDSQQLDYVRRIDIVSSHLFHFGARGLMRPVE